MNEKIIIDSGLTKEQAKIYLFLLENGLSPAKIIASKTGTGRALTYKVLEQLTALGLAEKREDIGKVALFFPAHPKKLKELAAARRERSEEAFQTLERSYGLFASSFNLLSGKPSIQFFEGTEGLQNVYADIIEVGQDIRVISSPIIEGRREVLQLIKEQIKKQVEQNIKTRAITPLAASQMVATPVEDDEKYLITRKKVPAEKLNIPAQIIIYGDKVAITNFKDGLVTVVMESKYIRETFEKMFEYIWEKS
ncbi:MAG: helix-turn-helix domain-containing protein [bacterium]|nr:helix-turn-helix domain-containing protein [bacterium]